MKHFRLYYSDRTVIEGDLRGINENGVPQARVKVLYLMNLVNIPKIVA